MKNGNLLKIIFFCALLCCVIQWTAPQGTQLLSNVVIAAEEDRTEGENLGKTEDMEENTGAESVLMIVLLPLLAVLCGLYIMWRAVRKISDGFH